MAPFRKGQHLGKVRNPKGNTSPAWRVKERAKAEEARRLSLRLLNRPDFRKTLAKKLDDLTVHPSILSLLMYYAYGKPTEMIEQKVVVPVRVNHVYSDGAEEP